MPETEQSLEEFKAAFQARMAAHSTVNVEVAEPFSVRSLLTAISDLEAYEGVRLELACWHAGMRAARMAETDFVVGTTNTQFLVFLMAENEARLAAGLKSRISRADYVAMVERCKADPQGKVFDGLVPVAQPEDR